MNNITILGSGAVGCTIAHKLHQPQNSSHKNITLVGRGEHLKQLTKNGLQIDDNGKNYIHDVNCIDISRLAELNKQDIIFITTKSHDIHEAAKNIELLYNDDTVVIPLANGIPWWFLHNIKINNKLTIPNNFELKNFIDEKIIPTERIIGGVIYTGASIIAPGCIINKTGPKIILGELHNKTTNRITEISNIFSDANINHKISNNIRGDILNKLSWNIAFNTLSVIYEMNSKEMVDNKETITKAKELMQEMIYFSELLDIDMQLNIEKHISIASSAGSHKPSMLQDYENNKKLEIYAIVGSVLDIANQLDIKLKHTKAIYKQLLDKTE